MNTQGENAEIPSWLLCGGIRRYIVVLFDVSSILLIVVGDL